MNFASDNWAGAAPCVMEALSRLGGFEPAYGADQISVRVRHLLEDMFGGPLAVAFVSSGTAANALCLSLATRPGAVVLCHEGAHIHVDEGGAPEFLGSLKLVTLTGRDGKLTPPVVEDALSRFSGAGVHHGRVTALSITQASELGTLYRPHEIRALADLAHGHGAVLHVDGARLLNAAATCALDLKAMTRDCGVDLLSLGLTKAGAFSAELAIAFDAGLGAELAHAQKRQGQLLSKGRLFSAQVLAMLEDGQGLALAHHANAMAAELAQGLGAICGVRLIAPVEANEIFALVPAAMASRLEVGGARFYDWPPHGLGTDQVPGANERLIRLVCSFATRRDEVGRFLALARSA